MLIDNEDVLHLRCFRRFCGGLAGTSGARAVRAGDPLRAVAGAVGFAADRQYDGAVRARKRRRSGLQVGMEWRPRERAGSISPPAYLFGVDPAGVLH